MKLGDIVKDYRASHKLSMEKFAELANLSKGYISMLEKGENPQTKKPISPSLETIQNIANAMQTDFDFLISQLDDNQIIRIAPTPTQPPSELVTAITDKVVQLTTPRQQTVLDVATDQLERQQKEEAIVEDTIISLDDYRERVDRTVKGKVSAGTGYWQEDDYDISVSFYADDIPDDDDYDSIAIVVGHSMEPKIKNGDFLFIKFTPDVDLNTIGIFQVNGENYVKKRKENYLQSLNPDCDDIHLTEDDHVRTIGEVVEVYRER